MGSFYLADSFYRVNFCIILQNLPQLTSVGFAYPGIAERWFICFTIGLGRMMFGVLLERPIRSPFPLSAGPFGDSDFEEDVLRGTWYGWQVSAHLIMGVQIHLCWLFILLRIEELL